VIHLLNFEFRHHPARRRMRELVTGGALGSIRHLTWIHHSAGSTLPLRQHGWLFRRELGGGWIGAWASHAIDPVRWVLGEVDLESVHAVLRTDVPRRPTGDADGSTDAVDTEDGLIADILTRGGATVSLDSTFAAPAPTAPRIIVVGTKATLECVADRRITVRSADGEQAEEIDVGSDHVDRHDAAMVRWAEVVRDAVHDRHQIEPSFADGLACDLVLDRLRAGTRVVAPTDVD